MNRKWILIGSLALTMLLVSTAVALSSSVIDPVTGAGPDFMVSLPQDNQREPSVAYNPDDDQYLVVWHDDRPGADDRDIYAQIVSADGIPRCDNFIVSDAIEDQAYPHATYDAIHDTYMVVWRDWRGGDWDVYGQVISATGTLSGTSFAVNVDPGNQKPEDLIYDPHADHYLVAWVDEGDWQVEGQLLDSAGGLIGTTPFTVSTIGGRNPQVAFNSHLQSYVVVYEDEGDIYGQAIAGDGSLSGSAFEICQQAAVQSYPDLAFNTGTQEYLVAWQDARNEGTTDTDVYALRIDEDGNPQGAETVISQAPEHQYWPQVAYNQRVNQWFVSWSDNRGAGTTGFDIYGQRVRGSDGSLAGQGNFTICDGPENQLYVRLAPRPKTGRSEYLAVWEDWRSDDGCEILGQRVGALLGTLNGHEFNISALLESQEHPRVAYNSTDQQFFVVWQDGRDGNSDILGQIVLTGSIPLTDNITIRDEAGHLADPVVAHNPYADTYLVAWDDETEEDIEGVILHSDGSAAGAAFNISSGTAARRNPAVAFNSDNSSYLVVFEYEGQEGWDIYGRSPVSYTHLRAHET